jgi:hypothetical protein
VLHDSSLDLALSIRFRILYASNLPAKQSLRQERKIQDRTRSDRHRYTDIWGLLIHVECDAAPRCTNFGHFVPSSRIHRHSGVSEVVSGLPGSLHLPAFFLVDLISRNLLLNATSKLSSLGPFSGRRKHKSSTVIQRKRAERVPE